MKVRFLIFMIVGLLFGAILIGSLGAVGDTTRAATSLSGLPETGKYNYVSLADVNKDGYLDVIVGAGGYPGNEPGGLYVYLNQNGRSFKDASTGLPGAGKNYFGSVQVIDIDGDSNLDIIAAYESQWSKGDDKGIGIWRGNGGSGGSMEWTAATTPVSSGSFDSANCADIDDDGKLDLVGGSSSGLYAWKGAHSGSSLSWTEASTGLPSSNEYTGVTLGDVNNDDRLDIVAGSYSSRGISVYLCSGSGSISWSDGHTDTNLLKNGDTFDMRVVDLNGDSNPDLVTGIRGGIKAYLGNGNSGSKDSWWDEVSTGLPTSGDYYELAIADINNDGNLDIGCSFKVWSNSGSMAGSRADSASYSWETLELGLSDSSSIGFAIGDLDNDGHKDIAACGWDIGVKAYTLTPGSGVPPEAKFTLGGTITDTTNGDPLSGVGVGLEPGGYRTMTNENGRYTLSITNGSYTLTLEFSGYQSDSANIEIKGNDIVKDFTLQPITSDDDNEDKDDSDSSNSDNGLPFIETPVIVFGFLIVFFIVKLVRKKK